MLRDAGIRRWASFYWGDREKQGNLFKKAWHLPIHCNLDALKITIGIRIYPYTALAENSMKEGLILPEDNLLFPTFYIVSQPQELAARTVLLWMADRHHWMF